MTVTSTPLPTAPQGGEGEALSRRLRAELRSAEAAHLGDGPGRMVHTRLPMRLVEQAKQRAGILHDEDLLQAALIHLVMDDTQH